MISSFVNRVKHGFFQWRIGFMEKELGYRLKLNPPENWIGSTLTADMTNVWAGAGLAEVGASYFTIGKVTNNLSERFNPNSDYYQAWLGGYIARFPLENNSAYEPFRLAVADQLGWLALYGDPEPKAEVDYDHIEVLGPIKTSGFSGSLYKGKIYSHSDVGNGRKSLAFPIVSSGLAYEANKRNSSLKAKSKNFNPGWRKGLEINPYHNITLIGFEAVIELGNRVKAVLYANGAEFVDKHGRKRNTFNKMEEELLQLLKGIEIQKITNY